MEAQFVILWLRQAKQSTDQFGSREVQYQWGALKPPMQFQNGDVLGVYQPADNDSVVQLYYVDDVTAPVALQRYSNQAHLSPFVS